MWDQRYSGHGFAYGAAANDFLTSMLDKLPGGRALCLAEGEGRNAVWLAQQGRDVTALDASAVGLDKARKLAASRGVSITTVHADLADYAIAAGHWDLIVSIFAHLPPALRQRVHQGCVEGLAPGGMMLLEAYTPNQLEYKTGGPPAVDLMMDSGILRHELGALEFVHLQECVREVHEGDFHTGTGAVVQLLAQKPAA